MEERLQKVIAQAGLASRRGAEEMIELGRVTVNGQRAEIGQKVDPSQDEIRIDGKLLPKQDRLYYYIVHKPRGVLSAAKADPQHPDLPIVTELVQTKTRLYPVGRLDINSEGLVLLTNDGELTNQITHPRYGHKKTYKVMIEGRIPERKLDIWRSGVNLPDGFRTAPCSVRVLQSGRESTWLRVVMSEGHKRQIREIGDALGYPVQRIIRTHIGPLEMGDLPPGKSRELSRPEVERLKESLAKEHSRSSKSGKSGKPKTSSKPKAAAPKRRRTE